VQSKRSADFCLGEPFDFEYHRCNQDGSRSRRRIVRAMQFAAVLLRRSFRTPKVQATVSLMNVKRPFFN